jgi:iduronate 2-sulfatase
MGIELRMLTTLQVVICWWFLMLALAPSCSGSADAGGDQTHHSLNLDSPNVLFVMFEDLRPDLPSYGNDLVISPNIDKLARGGLVFDMATAQVAVCAPSRTSMLTGLRPDTLGVRTVSPGLLSL